MRGFGATQVVERVPYSSHEDLRGLLDALGAGPAILVGCSMGAKTAIDFALEFPERTRALVLVGPTVGGFEPDVDPPEELDELLAAATVPVVRRLPGDTTVPDAYAAADAVVLPSTWEGFGNPALESVIHRRPLAIGRYPVAREIAAFGFRWFPADDPAPLDRWLDGPDAHLLDANLAIARRHFSLASLERRLARLLDEAGWTR